MKKIFLMMFCLPAVVPVSAQNNENADTVFMQAPVERRVYVEIGSFETHPFSGRYNAHIDLGQEKYFQLLGENGKGLKFNSMAGIMNYMSERGWRFVQADFGDENSNQYRWLMYKDVSCESEILEGLMVSNTATAPSKKKK